MGLRALVVRLRQAEHYLFSSDLRIVASSLRISIMTDMKPQIAIAKNSPMKVPSIPNTSGEATAAGRSIPDLFAMVPIPSRV